MNSQTSHSKLNIQTAGPNAEDAATTLILVHGRGANAASILSLYDELDLDSVCAIAPQATNGTWYPQSFLAPIEANQPYLDSALQVLKEIVADLVARGVPSEKIAFLGFSQGACLVCEFVARNPARYKAVMALTGGLIGQSVSFQNYSGSFASTPILLANGDPDPHVPFQRVEETNSIFSKLGAEVDLRRYLGMPHTIVRDELEACKNLLEF